MYDEFGFDNYPKWIYNMDKTGVPLEPRPPEIVTVKGQKKIRYHTSGQKSQITVIGCGSATGQILDESGWSVAVADGSMKSA